MKIVIVGQYYWPENFLVNDIAEDLVKRGHQVTMLTGLPDYATSIVPEEYKWFHRRHEYRNGVEIIRVPIIARRNGFVFRVLNYISFFITSSVYAYFSKLKADVIIAYQTAPVLMGNAAIILKKKLHIPLFYYCIDIWPEQMKVWNIRENNLLFKMMLRYCRYAYGSGNLVGVTSELFKKYLVEVNRVNSDKIVYLPQHSDAMQLTICEDKKQTNTIDFVFAGNIGQQQNVECIIKAVSLIKTDKSYMVHIYGDGTSYEKCVALAKSLNATNHIVFYGRVEKALLNDAYSQMDAFLLTLCGEDAIGFVANTVPAKLQGYLSAGKPIIAAIDGGAKEIIEKIGCGIAVDANDVTGLKKAMQDFIEHPDRYQECGQKGLAFFQDTYQKDKVMDKLEVYLERLCKGGVEKISE